MRITIAIIFTLATAFNFNAFGQTLPTTGLNFLDDSSYQSIPLASTPLLGNLPPDADLSSSFPVPGNQGAQASCVGWATAYAFKSFQEHQERKWPLSKEANLFSPAYVYNQINKSPNCKGGTSFVDALNLLRREGVASMEKFPYMQSECSRIPDASVKQSAKPFAIAEWRRVNVQDEIEVKTNVASGFPVLIGMIVDERFASLRNSQIYSSKSGASLGGHAMVVVGYDDNKGAFKVINSWGTDWGDGGFGWISYPAFMQTVREAYVSQDIILSPVRPTDNVPPDIRPPTIPHTPRALIGNAMHFHNLPVASPAGPVQGMQIVAPVQIFDAKGKTVQVVMKFSYFNGPPLNANPMEQTFRDIGGVVATGTLPRIAGSDAESLSDPITIPYYAFNFQPTNGFASYNLAFTVLVYIDNQLVAQSLQTPFTYRW